MAAKFYLQTSVPNYEVTLESWGTNEGGKTFKITVGFKRRPVEESEELLKQCSEILTISKEEVAKELEAESTAALLLSEDEDAYLKAVGALSDKKLALTEEKVLKFYMERLKEDVTHLIVPMQDDKGKQIRIDTRNPPKEFLETVGDGENSALVVLLELLLKERVWRFPFYNLLQEHYANMQTRNLLTRDTALKN